MPGSIEHIIASAFTSPWLIHPAKGEVIAEVLLRRMRGDGSPESAGAEVSAAREARARHEAAAAAAPSGIAVVPVFGTLVHRGSADNSSGVTSTETIARKLREAEASHAVGTIVLDIDSPGGQVAGTPELAAVIGGLKKPVVAVANSMAASAAYWLASQADEISVTPSGEVGSVGVVLVHRDVSEQLAKSGVRVTLVRTPDGKAAGHPFGPLSDEDTAHISEQVTATYRQFVSAVAAGRGVKDEHVETEFGGGRMLLAEAALSRGMVDRIETLDQALTRIANGGGPRRTTSSRAVGMTGAQRAALLS